MSLPPLKYHQRPSLDGAFSINPEPPAPANINLMMVEGLKRSSMKSVFQTQLASAETGTPMDTSTSTTSAPAPVEQQATSAVVTPEQVQQITNHRYFEGIAPDVKLEIENVVKNALITLHEKLESSTKQAADTTDPEKAALLKENAELKLSQQHQKENRAIEYSNEVEKPLSVNLKKVHPAFLDKGVKTEELYKHLTDAITQFALQSHTPQARAMKDYITANASMLDAYDNDRTMRASELEKVHQQQKALVEENLKLKAELAAKNTRVFPPETNRPVQTQTQTSSQTQTVASNFTLDKIPDEAWSYIQTRKMKHAHDPNISDAQSTMLGVRDYTMYVEANNQFHFDPYKNKQMLY